jgi:hypothetical protein
VEEWLPRRQAEMLSMKKKAMVETRKFGWLGRVDVERSGAARRAEEETPPKAAINESVQPGRSR